MGTQLDKLHPLKSLPPVLSTTIKHRFQITKVLMGKKKLQDKWHVRVSKQSCKQTNRLILWGVGAPQKKNFSILF
jgi:hypothetical protein